MIKIDVTDKVDFVERWVNVNDDESTLFFRCVCEKEFKYDEKFYDADTRLLWQCPECNAELYFENSGEKKNAIIQVIND